MKFKCSIDKITVAQLCVVTAIDRLYAAQSLPCVITDLKPIKIEIKPNMSQQLRDTLIIKKVPEILPGYTATVEGQYIVVSNQKPE